MPWSKACNAAGIFGVTSVLRISTPRLFRDPHLIRAYLGLVRETPGSRVVWLSSLAHRGGRIDFEDLMRERDYGPWAVYRQSKLADLVLALELQRRLDAAGSDTLSVAAHPGWTATNGLSRIVAYASPPG